MQDLVKAIHNISEKSLEQKQKRTVIESINASQNKTKSNLRVGNL